MALKNEKETNKKLPKGSIWWDIIGLVIKIGWIVLFFTAVFVFFIGVTVNNGVSMMPSFHDRDVIFYYRLANDFKAGETVVYEGRNGELITGRIIARNGDTADITEDGVKINGYYRKEDYISGETVLFDGGMKFPVTLSDGQYLILCDNRSEPSDSRIFGIITQNQIKGRVMLSIRQRDF